MFSHNFNIFFNVFAIFFPVVLATFISYIPIFAIFVLISVMFSFMPPVIVAILMDLIKCVPQTETSDISIAVKYINENYFKEDVLTTLYQSSYLSKYHFIRKFHNRTGQSPKEYFLHLSFDLSWQT